MKNSLNILTQQKQQEIDVKIKEKQCKELLQSFKKDAIVLLDNKIKKYYNKYGAFYILDNEENIIDEILKEINGLYNEVYNDFVDKWEHIPKYKDIDDLTKYDLIYDLFYKEFKKVKKQVDDYNKFKIEDEQEQINLQNVANSKNKIPKIWLIYGALKFINKRLKK